MPYKLGGGQLRYSHLCEFRTSATVTGRRAGRASPPYSGYNDERNAGDTKMTTTKLLTGLMIAAMFSVSAQAADNAIEVTVVNGSKPNSASATASARWLAKSSSADPCRSLRAKRFPSPPFSPASAGFFCSYINRSQPAATIRKSDVVLLRCRTGWIALRNFTDIGVK
jgi:hypothetical protein